MEHQLETAKAEVDKPFPQEAELSEKLERLAELNALLNMDEKGKLSDRPAERTSLQEKLAAMKARVSGTPAGRDAADKAKKKEKIL